MSPLRLLALLALTLFPLSAQDVGQGASPGITQLFVNAFFRNRFNAYVTVPAATPVNKLGATGFVQEFNGVTNKTARFALVKADSNLGIGNGLSDVFQMYPALYSAYNGAGVTNAGYPTMDTGTCPATTTGSTTTVCAYQLFSGHYALFAFPSTLVADDSNSNYTVRDPFYTRWASLGSITGPGTPTTAETAITSTLTAVTATGQQYLTAGLYNITSGVNSGKLFAVTGKVYTLYSSLSLHSGSLGLPTSDELAAGLGKTRQAFEGGVIELSTGADPVVRPAVGAVTLSISGSGVTRMNIGDTLSISAIVTATVGGVLTDRQVSWVTSNGRVVAIQPSGGSAVLQAVGGGTALISAVSEGKVSPNLTIFVAAPCCQIGEGAPTVAIQQSFQDAVTRHHLNIKLPAANPVRRTGMGYVQDLQTADAVPVHVLLCRSDLSPGVFVVVGDILNAYLALNGPSGTLAYPTADETATGRQMFEGGALAGRPVQAVTGAILNRWQSLGFETGSVGPPIASGRSYLSFAGSTGVGQMFRSGLIVSIQTGSFASSATTPVVLGPFLTRYSALNGPAGSLGFPFTDQYTSKDGIVQDFEGAELRLTADGTDADVVPQQRKPQITVNPTRVTAGGRVRISIGGFQPGATLHISFAGASAIAPFDVQTDQGSYTWETPVPSATATGAVTVTAKQTDGSDQATSSYTITALTEAALQLTKVSGDTQTGLPGARLNNPLVISLRDDQGSPLVGIDVKFATSPGASVVDASAVTDQKGQAQALIRAQNADGILLVTAAAANKVVTFSARVAGTSLTAFPKLTRAGSSFTSRENLVAAAASIIRYHQARNEMPSSLGTADVATLNDYLKNYCVLDSTSGKICDGFLSFNASAELLPNLWRLKDFTGNNLDVESLPPSDDAIRDLLALGSPVLIPLSVSDDAGLAGTHFVVAIGASSDGATLIQDPEPIWNRQRLSDYTDGFSAAGKHIQATILNTMRLVPRSPSPTSFLTISYQASIGMQSVSGECGTNLSWPLGDGAGGRPSGNAQVYYCSGLNPTYAASFTATAPYQAVLTDLGSPGRKDSITGSGGEAYSVTRPDSLWRFGPIQLSVSADNVVNAATFTPDFAPGSLIAITGSGLSDGSSAVVEVAGSPATVQLATQFRLNVEIPTGTPPGDQTLHISSPYGTVDLPIQIRDVAPQIFTDSKTLRPMIVNATGGQPNTPYNPVTRGGTISIYATGLGAVSPLGNLTVTAIPVTVVLQGAEFPATFAGPGTGLPGVYLVNFAVPTGAAPGLDLPLLLRQSGVDSAPVPVSVR